MRKAYRISREGVNRCILRQYKNYAGIGPYYLPLFGRIFWKRLDICLQLLSNFIDLNSNSKLNIGDLGCGLGVFTVSLTKSFPNSTIIGLDIYSPEILKHTRKMNDHLVLNHSTHFISGDIQELPFKSNYFDVVFSLDVLEHVFDPIKALDELKRVLRDGGIFIVSVPVESTCLKIIRYIYTFGGRRGENDPHWHGTIKGFKEFRSHLVHYFKLVDENSLPFRGLAYDCIYLCKK